MALIINPDKRGRCQSPVCLGQLPFPSRQRHTGGKMSRGQPRRKARCLYPPVAKMAQDFPACDEVGSAVLKSSKQSLSVTRSLLIPCLIHGSAAGENVLGTRVVSFCWVDVMEETK